MILRIDDVIATAKLQDLHQEQKAECLTWVEWVECLEWEEWECHLEWECKLVKILINTILIQIIMVKHRRYSDKPKEDSIQKDEKIEFQDQEISSEKSSFDLKPLLLSEQNIYSINIRSRN